MAFKKIRRSNFLIKLTSWEYWPFGILQAPVFLYWIWLSIKARSLFFFSASNPGILSGGMMGESKYDILERVPDAFKPKTIRLSPGSATAEVLTQLRQAQLSFPLIFKPDIGERGWMVRRIHSEEEVVQYLSEIQIDFIAQELIDLPLEFGVFYLHHPEEKSGWVNSIAMKEFLSVKGDGQKTLRQLILEKDRAKLQWETLQSTYVNILDEILPAGEKKELVSIGNHCLGTKFLDAGHLITPALNDSFNRISQQIPGFYFGRFDLRCASFTDLENGQIKILELNGCGAEPAHIYQPGYSFWKALSILIEHVHQMYLISIANHARGVPYLSFTEGVRIYRKFQSIKS